jgi:hypothetical protein
MALTASEKSSDAKAVMSYSIPMRTLVPIVVLVLWGAGLFVEPYSTHSRRDYQRQAQLVFRAALEHDSAALRRAASPEVLATLLRAAENSPGVIQAWSRSARPYHDIHVGDTTFVWFTVSAACTKHPLTMAFLRPAAELRVISLFNTCGV